MTDPQYSLPPATPYAPAGAPLEERTNVLAIVALVAAFVVPLVGIICGHIALSQIKRTGERGRALAIWALVLGYLGILLGIVYAVVIIGVIASGVASGAY